MRAADIRIGEEYAVRVNPEQVVVTWPVDEDDDMWGPTGARTGSCHACATDTAAGAPGSRH